MCCCDSVVVNVKKGWKCENGKKKAKRDCHQRNAHDRSDTMTVALLLQLCCWSGPNPSGRP